MWLISEEDVRYENMSTETAKFTHTCQYDQQNSFSLQTSKGHKIGISGGLGVSAFGNGAGVGTNYVHSRAKANQQDGSQGKSNISTVEVIVELDTAIVVKELIYEVEKSAHCTLELVLEDGEKNSIHKLGQKCNMQSRSEETME